MQAHRQCSHAHGLQGAAPCLHLHHDCRQLVAGGIVVWGLARNLERLRLTRYMLISSSMGVLNVIFTRCLGSGLLRSYIDMRRCAPSSPRTMWCWMASSSCGAQRSAFTYFQSCQMFHSEARGLSTPAFTVSRTLVHQVLQTRLPGPHQLAAQVL